jgi:hypothetical protein
VTTPATRAHRALSRARRTLLAGLLGLLRAYEDSPGSLGSWW